MVLLASVRGPLRVGWVVEAAHQQGVHVAQSRSPVNCFSQLGGRLFPELLSFVLGIHGDDNLELV